MFYCYLIFFYFFLQVFITLQKPAENILFPQQIHRDFVQNLHILHSVSFKQSSRFIIIISENKTTQKQKNSVISATVHNFTTKIQQR